MSRKADATDFAQWVCDNPEPNLHDLIKTHGTYWNIPEQAWRDYLAALSAWQLKRKDRFWS